MLLAFTAAAAVAAAVAAAARGLVSRDLLVFSLLRGRGRRLCSDVVGRLLHFGNCKSRDDGYDDIE